MVIKSGLLGVTSVLLLTPAGLSDKHRIFEFRQLVHTLAYVIAIHTGKADIEQHQIGVKGFGDLNGVWPVFGKATS